MQAARMNFQEETLRLRQEARQLRQTKARLERSNHKLKIKVGKLETANRRLKTANKRLKAEIVVLKENQAKQTMELESLRLIVEELRRMIFGKGKKKKGEEGEPGGGKGEEDKGHQTKKGRKKADRPKSSYRRPVPSDKEVTAVHKHRLTHCPDCETRLKRLKTITRYREDLEKLSRLHQLVKRVEKHLITTGYCPQCRKKKAAKEISPQECSLGEETKRFIAYSVVIMRQSFEQVKRFLRDIAKLRVSDGEIANSLAEQAEKLTKERDRLVNKIRGAPGRHYDETGWKVQSGGQGDYGWVSTATEGEDTVYLLGRSRGKANAEELRGPTDDQVGISDDYVSYRKLFKKHQLCWSHPKRKLRDLKDSTSLAKSRRKRCVQVYQEFSDLYQKLESTLATEYNQDEWLKKRDQYLKSLRIISQIKSGEPLKLREIKKGLQRNAEKYFTCLLEPGIPADNNKAERALRHLVLKRKMSYGSKSQKGADTMAILFSTMLSKWWNKPDNFFEAYDQMLSE